MGQIELTVPQRGSSQTVIDGGVGQIIVRVPQGVAARIQVEGGLGGVVNGTFQKSGDTYTSPGYATAENRADVRVNSGARATNDSASVYRIARRMAGQLRQLRQPALG